MERIVRIIRCRALAKGQGSKSLWAGIAMALLTFGFASQTALADVPSVTDFGGKDSSFQDVWQQSNSSSRYAMFLTLYQDGRRQVDIRPISGDEIVSFRTEHRAWEFSPTLMWFVDMPVYVREVGAVSEATSI